MEIVQGSYDPLLVAVSVGVAILSSFVALTTVPRIHAGEHGRLNLLWIAAFGLSMGTGIWSMHFVAMLALHLPVEVSYDPLLTLLSLVLAVVASAAAILPLRAGGEIGMALALRSGIPMGLAIAGMHYTGMAAMRMPVGMRNDSAIVVLAVAIAIVASIAALLLANRIRAVAIFEELRPKALSALAMGAAIATMHFVAMSGVRFIAGEECGPLSAGINPDPLALFVTILAFLIQSGVLIVALYDEAYSGSRRAASAVRRRAEVNQTISHILSLALKERDLAALLQKTLDTLLGLEWLSLERSGAIFVADPGSGRLRMVAERNLSPELRQRCAELAPGYCLCGRAALQQQLIYKLAIDEDHEVRTPDMLPHGHYCVPIVASELTLGVLNLHVESDHRQQEEELRLLRTVADVLATVLIQNQLRSQSDKIHIAVEQAGESVMITNRDGIIEYVNRAFCRITGYSEAEAIGRKASLIKSGVQSEGFYAQMWETILGGRIWQGEVADRRKDGSHYPAMLTISPIHAPDGRITHFVGIHEDLSEHKALERQFRHAQKMEALGTLVGGIAHDFNNMLAAMTGNIFLLKYELQGKPGQLELLAQVETVAFQAAEMIRQMLIFARNEQVELAPLQLAPYLKELLKLHRVAVPADIAFEQSISPQSMSVLASPSMLQQVLLNLISNAVDAVRDVPAPRIECALAPFAVDAAFAAAHPGLQPGPHAMLSVSDNGHGIDADHLEHIFDPFFTTKEVGRGTGLGLSMALSTVRLHKGGLTLESEPGKGSTFRILLPLIEGEAVARPEVVFAAIGHGEKVLLVDDDEGVLKAVGDALRRMGFSVEVSRNGLEGLDRYRKGGIDLVVLDLVMPVLGGVSAARALLREYPDARILFATGYDRERSLRNAPDLAHIPLLVKPFDPVRLGNAIRTLLDGA